MRTNAKSKDDILHCWKTRASYYIIWMDETKDPSEVWYIKIHILTPT
jgi:hypothetical protein